MKFLMIFQFIQVLSDNIYMISDLTSNGENKSENVSLRL